VQRKRAPLEIIVMSWDRFVKLDGDCLLSRGADGLVIEDHDMARETLVLPA
jgi:hypothetical protein